MRAPPRRRAGRRRSGLVDFGHAEAEVDQLDHLLRIREDEPRRHRQGAVVDPHVDRVEFANLEADITTEADSSGKGDIIDLIYARLRFEP